MARLLREGRDRVEDRTGRRPGKRAETWPADLRNAAKDTPPEDVEMRRANRSGSTKRAVNTVGSEPLRGRQEALF